MRNSFYRLVSFFLLVFLIFNCSSTPKQIDPVKEVSPVEKPVDKEIVEEKELPNEPVENTIYFDFNEFEINEEYFNLLSLHVNYLKSITNAQLILEGNTDSIGSNEANYELGIKRVLAIFNYLTAQGIAQDRIDYRSLGEKNPLYPEENNQEEQAKNRRVELYYTY